jgi:hypothetical protein
MRKASTRTLIVLTATAALLMVCHVAMWTAPAQAAMVYSSDPNDPNTPPPEMTGLQSVAWCLAEEPNDPNTPPPEMTSQWLVASPLADEPNEPNEPPPPERV